MGQKGITLWPLETFCRAWGCRLEVIHVSVLLACTHLVQMSVVDLLYNQGSNLQFITNKEYESFIKD